jgi:hypothetical protein
VAFGKERTGSGSDDEGIMTTNTERVKSLLEYVRKEQTKRELKESQITTLQLTVEDKKKSSEILLKVLDLFKKLGGENEEDLLRKIERFVSFGLGRIFGAGVSFVIQMETQGKDLRVDFLVKQKEREADVINACGGGVAEVVGILLQLFFVVMKGKGKDQLFLLDTSLVHLASDVYVKRMSQLLKEISGQLNVQTVLLTHTNLYGDLADVCYKFSQEDGKTQVEVVK